MFSRTYKVENMTLYILHVSSLTQCTKYNVLGKMHQRVHNEPILGLSCPYGFELNKLLQLLLLLRVTDLELTLAFEIAFLFLCHLVQNLRHPSDGTIS